jgi:5-carboxymethyl-2-hydroxymuconate isomerase
MPHVTLEYSANLPEPPDLMLRFAALHQSLAQLGIAVDECKSRAHRCDAYLVGTGAPKRAFAHLTLSLLDHRPADAQRAAGEIALRFLEALFSSAALDCDLTVEVRPMVAALYFKTRSLGGATQLAD